MKSQMVRDVERYKGGKLKNQKVENRELWEIEKVEDGKIREMRGKRDEKMSGIKQIDWI